MFYGSTIFNSRLTEPVDLTLVHQQPGVSFKKPREEHIGLSEVSELELDGKSYPINSSNIYRKEDIIRLVNAIAKLDFQERSKIPTILKSKDEYRPPNFWDLEKVVDEIGSNSTNSATREFFASKKNGEQRESETYLAQARLQYELIESERRNEEQSLLLKDYSSYFKSDAEYFEALNSEYSKNSPEDYAFYRRYLESSRNKQFSPEDMHRVRRIEANKEKLSKFKLGDSMEVFQRALCAKDHPYHNFAVTLLNHAITFYQSEGSFNSQKFHEIYSREFGAFPSSVYFYYERDEFPKAIIEARSFPNYVLDPMDVEDLNVNLEEARIIPEDFYCPLTKEPIKDPVVAASGQIFERKAIEAWLKKHNECPVTNMNIKGAPLYPVYSMKGLIEKLSNVKELREIPDEFICPITQLPMKDPVVTASGQMYEGNAIAAWLVNNSKCPLTGVNIKDKPLYPVDLVKSQIGKFIKKP